MGRLTVRKSSLALALYIAATLVFFVLIVQPSLSGVLKVRVTADSELYISLADALSSTPERLVGIGANYLGPFLILRLARYNQLAVALLNCGLFVAAYLVLVKNFELSRLRLLGLLFLNPMVAASLLSVNKEILALVCTAFIACYLATGRRWQLVTALVFSILTRWQMTVVILILLGIRSRLNPWMRYRWLTLAVLVGLITVLYPPVLRVAFAAGLESQFTSRQLASTAGLTQLLETVQANYGFFLVLVPKLVLNYFGNVLRIFDFVVRPDSLDYGDIYNNMIVLGHQICMLMIFLFAIRRRKLSLANDSVYFLAIYSLVFAIGILINYRYFFPVYLILCLELSLRRSAPTESPAMPSSTESSDQDEGGGT